MEWTEIVKKIRALIEPEKEELTLAIDQSVKKHFDSKLSPDGFIYKKK